MSASPFDLTGKTAFITGASRGIGRAVAVAMAAAGADLALVARSEDGLAGTARAAGEHGRKAFVIPADVTSEDAVDAAVASAIEQLGRIDIVVNNAGGTNFMVPFAELRMAGWDKIMRLNATSVAYVRSDAGPLPVSPRNSTSDARPPSEIATAASNSERERVKRSSESPCASRPRACRRLMIERTSSRRSFPRKYAAVACPASCVATDPRSSSVYTTACLTPTSSVSFASYTSATFICSLP